MLLGLGYRNEDDARSFLVNFVIKPQKLLCCQSPRVLARMVEVRVEDICGHFEEADRPLAINEHDDDDNNDGGRTEKEEKSNNSFSLLWVTHI
jgi:hypothetical protein